MCFTLNSTQNDADNDCQAAVTSIPYNYKLLKISQMDAALDYWNLMVSLEVLCLPVPVD